MPKAEDILWFKQQFGEAIEAAIEGTPFTVDMLTAIACQETGYIWQQLRKRQLPVSEILELCVGDTLDSDKGRSAFPKTKTDLVSRTGGEAMFAIARQALLNMAHHVRDYQPAAAKPNKFCHGFGIFQYDLQFFQQDPEYFLEKRYADFNACLDKCLAEFRRGLRVAGLQDKTELTDYEAACVAIAYNTGGFKPSKGLKQGYFNGTRYYGEEFFDFLRLSKTVTADPASPSVLTAPSPGTAILPPPTPIEATGRLYEVDVRSDPLRLRSDPSTDTADPNANVIARLPDGHIVQAVTNKKVSGFLEVETSLRGAHFRGFASAQFLKAAPEADSVPVPLPATTPPESGIVAVFMPRKSGVITRRTQPAGPHSLNESSQPSREADSPEGLREDLAAIIDWLAVDNSAHARYQPHNRTTFCNIYAHDYCHLAGVYLPRVWWTSRAIESLAQGQSVDPLYGQTIDELRANDLFRWLRDYGLRFGWRQTGTLSKLQLEVNQGAVGLIVARRKEDGLSGHIVPVVPETDEQRARRNGDGDVIAPLQSQAGTTNFSYSTGKLDWWKGDQFADSAFWLHA